MNFRLLFRGAKFLNGYFTHFVGARRNLATSGSRQSKLILRISLTLVRGSRDKKTCISLHFYTCKVVFRQPPLPIVTGSIASIAKRQYLSYSEADFEVLHPAGATCSSDGGETWHGGVDRAKFRRAPTKCVKYPLRNNFAPRKSRLKFTPGHLICHQSIGHSRVSIDTV